MADEFDFDEAPKFELGEDGLPDVHSPEFQNFMMNQLLKRYEMAGTVLKVADILDRDTPLEELDRKTWAAICLAASDMRTTAEFVQATLKAAPAFTDDPEAIQLVKEKTIEHMKKDHEDGG